MDLSSYPTGFAVLIGRPYSTTALYRVLPSFARVPSILQTPNLPDRSGLSSRFVRSFSAVSSSPRVHRVSPVAFFPDGTAFDSISKDAIKENVIVPDLRYSGLGRPVWT